MVIQSISGAFFRFLIKFHVFDCEEYVIRGAVEFSQNEYGVPSNKIIEIPPSNVCDFQASSRFPQSNRRVMMTGQLSNMDGFGMDMNPRHGLMSKMGLISL